MELEGGGHRQSDQGTDHQDPHDPDGNRNGGGHQDGEHVVDGPGLHSQDPGAVFVKGQEHQLGEQAENGQQGDHGKDGHSGHFPLADGEDAAVQEGIHIGMDQPGTDDGNGNAHGQGQDDH